MEVSAASAAMMMVGHLALPKNSWSADGDILPIRNYSDILILDPLNVNTQFVCNISFGFIDFHLAGYLQPGNQISGSPDIAVYLLN